MNTLLKKEMRLSALLLTYLFIGFAFMTLLPGYPILCGVFFITLGIYQSFQNARESNDIVFSALLPIAKRDVVKLTVVIHKHSTTDYEHGYNVPIFFGNEKTITWIVFQKGIQ
jgi:hypothetical protein